MISLKYEKLGYANCEKIYNSWENEVKKPTSLEGDSQLLRNAILAIHSDLCKDDRTSIPKGKFDKYNYDLLFGLRLFELLSEDNGFSLRHASDADIWRHISMKVVPDLIYFRWGKESTDRYFRRPTRIYFSSLWWYIYLSWAGTTLSTYEILKNNTTDEIMNLVERSGPLGYRVDFTRELMKQYSMYPNEDRYLFRKVLKLNTARSVVIEPLLHRDGVDGYVNELFNDIMRGVINEEASGGY